MKRGVAALKKLPRFALGEVGEKAESSKTRGQLALLLVAGGMLLVPG